MAKKLPMKRIYEENEQFKEQWTLEFDNGEYEVKIFPYFSPTRVVKCVRNIGKELKELEDLGINFDDEHLDEYIHYHIVKEFTDIRTPSNRKKDIRFFEVFINTD